MFTVSESIPFEERTTQSDDQREREQQEVRLKRILITAPFADGDTTARTQEGVSLSLSGVVIWYSALISRLIASREADSGGRGPEGSHSYMAAARRGQIQKKRYGVFAMLFLENLLLF